jgi:hypothetical protein
MDLYTYAATMQNDGDIKEENTIYTKDSGIPPAYDVDYYDAWYPYKKTFEDIGGYMINAATARYGATAMSSSVRKSKIGSQVTWEGSESMARSTYSNYSGSYSYSKEGYLITKDKNGNQFIVVAVQPYTNNIKTKSYSMGEMGSPPAFFDFNVGGESDKIRGQLVDAILTDGTVLHLMLADAQAKFHTNGWQWSWAPGQKDFDGLYEEISKLNYDQYIYMYGGLPGHTIELFANSSSACSSLVGNSCVAYERSYKAHIQDNLKRQDGYTTSYKDKIDNLTVDPNAKTEDPAKKANDNANKDNTVDDKFIPEKDLYGIGNLDTLSTTQKEVSLASNEDFNEGQLELVGIQKKDLENNFIATVHFWIRVLVAWVGMVLMLYAVLLLLAYLFDRSNNFFSISLVGLMTMGHIKYTDYHDSYDSSSSATLRKVLTSSIILIIVASVLISGSMYVGIRKWLEVLMR